MKWEVEKFKEKGGQVNEMPNVELISSSLYNRTEYILHRLTFQVLFNLIFD